MSEQSKRTILVVEDEEPILQGLTDVLVYHGYDVVVARDGEEGLKKYNSEHPDLVLLDVMLPKRDGFSVCNEIRKSNREQPIIMLTAKTGDDDIVTGLTLGADDYVGKPFSVRELVLRISSVLRRSRKTRQEERELVLKDLVIDKANLSGRNSSSSSIEFTRREVDILEYLFVNGDRPVSRDELLTEVWGYERSSEIETRTVDIHIAKLRKKIESDPKNPSLLTTLRGEGYKLAL